MLQISTTTRARTDPWHAIVAAELKADRFRAIGSTQDYQVMFGLLRSIWEQHVNEVRRRLYYGVFQLVSVLVLIVIFKLWLWRWHSCKWGLSGMWSAFFCSREKECGGERCSKSLIELNTYYWALCWVASTEGEIYWEKFVWCYCIRAWELH